MLAVVAILSVQDRREPFLFHALIFSGIHRILRSYFKDAMKVAARPSCVVWDVVLLRLIQRVADGALNFLGATCQVTIRRPNPRDAFHPGTIDANDYGSLDIFGFGPVALTLL
jgi:hypothetical protein